jgi:hypothetical protein
LRKLRSLNFLAVARWHLPDIMFVEEACSHLDKTRRLVFVLPTCLNVSLSNRNTIQSTNAIINWFHPKTEKLGQRWNVRTDCDISCALQRHGYELRSTERTASLAFIFRNKLEAVISFSVMATISLRVVPLGTQILSSARMLSITD